MATLVPQAHNKMSRLQKFLLRKARHIENFDTHSIRRVFTNSDLRKIGNSPWGSFAINARDLKIINLIIPLIEPIFTEREKNKQAKKVQKKK